MTIENTTSTSSSSTVPAAATSGSTVISASTFQQMLQILDDLTDHSHTVYDDYTSVCQCNCACGRGIV